MFSEEVEVVGGENGQTSASEQSSANEQSSTSSQSSANEHSSADAIYLQVSRDELATLIRTAANDAANSAAESVTSTVGTQLESMSSDISSLGTVTLVPEQFDKLAQLGSTDLHVGVVAIGLLSLLLGAVVATAMSLHWRGRG